MNKQELTDIVRNLRKIHSNKPIRVKVNESWLNEQLGDVIMIEDPKIKGINSFYGLPLEIDNRIQMFEFVYKKPK
ncbi:hypothetical protein [Priestia megaterium]|uniref:hypothetical protein n=1 Tax=Priestia megaterium TaxID=1404 RepID=UPI000CA36761|nr:hypothetical protein [Priestia megaterium]AUO14813.1 hypothetical protein C0569_26380 [Priestia megaterium]